MKNLYNMNWLFVHNQIKSAKQYISGILYVHWRESLTLYIHREYFQSANYYQINILRAGNIDNP